MGTRTMELQCCPSDDVLNTISFDEQPARKLQSCHATNVLPFPSTSAAGSGPASRKPAARGCSFTFAIKTLEFQDLPPFVESMLSIPFPRYGNTTVPFGCTTGRPPFPAAPPADGIGVD